MAEFSVTTDWLKVRAEATPDAVALIGDDFSVTFGELDRMVSRLCYQLKEEGVRPGDHVGLLMPNCLAAVCSVFSAARIGAVLVPLNTRLTPAELSWQIDRADCDWLLCSETYDGVARSVSGGSVQQLILHDNDAAFSSWLDLQPDLVQATGMPGPLESLQAIVFTSGTTGFPKGTMITFANHLWSAVGSAFKLGIHHDDRWLACMPLYHVGGLSILFRSCLYGTTVVLQRGFDPSAVRKSLTNDAITQISLVPTMLARLLKEGLSAIDAPSLRFLLLGGAAASPELLAEAAVAGLPVAVTYGLTEACSQVATMLPGDEQGKPGSPGRPLLFTSIDIVAENGTPAQALEPGEIVISGPTIMSGYYNDPEATAGVLHGGRLHTGDIGYLDGDGDLWVLNRRSDLIISGGENVYPAEVERIILAHPAVTAVAVVGLPHAEWGHEVAAMVTPEPGSAISESELNDFIRKQLAGYKQPRVIIFSDEIPMTGSGKINRSEVVNQILAQRVVS